jgi:hypothetical protein
MLYTSGTHTFRWGAEIRLNKDATIFGTNPNGAYSFGAGTAYSPVLITSASGQHNILPGQPLPDALTGLLTATPYSYTIASLDKLTASGDKFDEAAVRRESYNFYSQDSWKATPRLNHLRPALRIQHPHQGSPRPHHWSQTNRPQWPASEFSYSRCHANCVVQPAPSLSRRLERLGSAPFAGLCRHCAHYHPRWRRNHHRAPQSLAGQLRHRRLPVSFSGPRHCAANFRRSISQHVCALALPDPYTIQGQLLFAAGTNAVPPNTAVDLQRYQDDLAAITPGHETQLLTLAVID